MANNLVTNPIYLDTFVSDIVVSSGPVAIKDVVLYGGGAAKVTLTDASTTRTYAICGVTAAGETDGFSPYTPVQCTDLTVDVSQGTFPAGTIVLIYV